jgi:processive 1,2-diacylglycerol beta-glucosyltransferase
MRARALAAWAAREGTGPVRVHQALESTHPLYAFGVGVYNTIQRTWPALHQIYFHFLEVAAMFRTADRIQGRDRFLEVVRVVDPDVVVSVHASTNHGFFDLVKQVCPGARCVTYCGELHGGRGFSRHWVNPRADLFIGAVEETCEAARGLGMPPDRVVTGGFLLDPSFWEPRMDEAAREAYVRRELGMDPERFILLLGTGAAGANNHEAFLRALKRAGRRVQVLVLCGRNSRVMMKMETWIRRHPGWNIRALPYTREMARLLEVASAAVIRPGTGTTSESILRGCPVILNRLGGIMPQEEITVRFLRQRGIGAEVRTAEDLPRILESWADRREHWQEQRARMEAVRPPSHPVKILQHLGSVCGGRS